jgi:zinc D-Ala-D-Ala carboxypeptidase
MTPLTFLFPVPLCPLPAMYDDIPQAKRQHAIREPSTKASFPTALLIGGGVAILAIATGVFALSRFTSKSASVTTDPGLTAAPTTSVSPIPSAASSPNEEQLLGHLSYKEAPVDELDTVSEDGTIRLRQSAAAAYRRMAADAAAAGIVLFPLSGFRSITDQNDLFFRVKEERNQAVSNRAAVSAPPGHSEHHTGYAIDVGDGDRKDTHLSESFESTPAYQWLAANAARYSFELSFPRNNPQGVSYEPWHWRYVGDQDSLKTFYRAHQIKQK